MEILKKRPLRPGQSYALKPSQLAALIEEHGIVTPATLHQVSETWWTEGVLFRGDFYPPGEMPEEFHTKTSNEETLRITCRSVPTDERVAASAYLESSVLPAFAKWMVGIEKQPKNATIRQVKQSFTRSWDGPKNPTIPS